MQDAPPGQLPQVMSPPPELDAARRLVASELGPLRCVAPGEGLEGLGRPDTLLLLRRRDITDAA